MTGEMRFVQVICVSTDIKATQTYRYTSTMGVKKYITAQWRL